MGFALKSLAAIGLASLGFAASAGQFSAIGSGTGIDIAENIADLVSDKFTNRYPVSQYSIHVIYDFQTYSDGGGVGFAVAGVVPRAKSKDWVYTPIGRYVVTQRFNGKAIGPKEKFQLTVETIRLSVEHMMAECDASPKCDILQ